MSDYTSETTDRGWIEVSKLGSGWAAIHVVNVTTAQGSSYIDVQSTGLGRYPTKLEAVYEAREWAENEGLEFKEPTNENHS